MNDTLPLAQRRITPPAHFPVAWPQKGDEAQHWTRDREHMPQPITPLFASVAALTAGPGRARTVEVYAEAIVGREDRTINGYDYTRLIPFSGTPAELEARTQRNRAILLERASRLSELWRNQWRPELERHWEFWRRFDLQSASLVQLQSHLAETLERLTRMYEIHFLMGPPMWFAIDEFESFYCDLFPGSSALDAQRLLQGFDNQTLRIGRQLAHLAQLAQRQPQVQQALLELAPRQALAALTPLPEAQDFLAQLQEFLRHYGRRSDLWDWGYPSWEEDPAPLLNQIRLHLAAPERDLKQVLAAAARTREDAILAARSALQGYPRPVLERFELLLHAAQTALVLSEDHTYYIDFNGFGWARRVLCAAGERLAAQGRLENGQDVFYLSIQEVQAMLANPQLDLGEQARRNRQANTYWAGVQAPASLGTLPEQPLYLYSADARRMLRYIGGYAADSAAPTPPRNGLLHGQPGSSGKVRGQARRVLALADAHRLAPGEVLVTTTTAPPWTPLFLSAAALVTDAGGLLSHGAVVCREYGIPAVVGTGCATSFISDGAWVEVDGDQGLVRLLEV